MLDQAIETARNQKPRFLEELKEVLRIPSISTLPEHRAQSTEQILSVAHIDSQKNFANWILVNSLNHDKWLSAATCLH